MTNKTRTITSDLNYSGTPRHLLVFMDGTWNDESGKENDGITTNIYKLFRSLEGNLSQSNSIPHVIEHENHVALYFRGIGNDDDFNMLGSYHYGAFGGGEKRIRDHAYVSIMEHYRSGDKISIFGFSRGAASARMLAGDIEKEGVAHTVKVHSKTGENKSTGKEEDIYKKYSKLSDKRKRDVPVHFLGIFDTVGAFGIPVNLGLGLQKINLFKDMTVSKNVSQVVHCVSIDESREPFIPTLCNKASNVDEVWFTGAHADLGGGYRNSQLSRIPLKYMVTKLNKKFASDPIDFNEKALEQLTNYDLNDDFYLHYHGDGMVKERRIIGVQKNGEMSAMLKPRIHSSVDHFINGTSLSLSTPSNSFCEVSKITYLPRSINGLKGNYTSVK